MKNNEVTPKIKHSSSFLNAVHCEDTCEKLDPCWPIKDETNITRFQNLEERHIHPRADCMEFIRSAEVCGTGISSLYFEKERLVKREQLNELTAFIDAGNLYGADAARAKYIREHNPDYDVRGKIRRGDPIPIPTNTNPKYTNANMTKEILTFDVSFITAMGGAPSVDRMDCRREAFFEAKDVQDVSCFLAGDRRANIHLGLTILHTIYTRMHNTMVDKVRPFLPEPIKPRQSDRKRKHRNRHTQRQVYKKQYFGQRWYHEVRRLITFHMQQFTYERWLPIILGGSLEEYQGYNDTIEVGIYNEFATAAFRKGVDYKPLDTWPMHKLLFAPYLLYNAGGIDPLLRGLISSPVRDNSKPGTVSDELTENFFKNNEDVPLDLAAINIQRGRDHGIPGYKKYLDYCGLKSNLPENILQIYENDLNKVDLWVGVISEKNFLNGKVGPLGKCLIEKQFKEIRDGDKFWYQNQLSEVQIAELRKLSLEKIICDHGDGIIQVPEDVLRVGSRMVDCGSLPDVDYRVFDLGRC